jgi:hypothetical protein
MSRTNRGDAVGTSPPTPWPRATATPRAPGQRDGGNNLGGVSEFRDQAHRARGDVGAMLPRYTNGFARRIASWTVTLGWKRSDGGEGVDEIVARQRYAIKKAHEIMDGIGHVGGRSGCAGI